MASKNSPHKEEDDDDKTQLPTPLHSPNLARQSRSSSVSSSDTLLPQPFPLETHAPSPSSDIEDADPLEYVAETDDDDAGYTTAPPPMSGATTTTFSTIDSGALYHMRYRYGERPASTPTHRRTSSRANKICRRCGHAHRSHRHCRTVSVIHEQGLSKDFFLIITLCFVAAVLIICILRPPTIWMRIYRDTLQGLHPDRIF